MRPHGPRHASLVRRASTNRTRAYAPYSGFRTGAVVLDDDGSAHDGALVENVSLGLAMCAERVALHACVAAGGAPQALILVAPPTGDQVTWPCGACLQTALELGGPELEVSVAPHDRTDADSVQRARVGDLLPNGPYRADHALAGSG